MGLVSKVKLLAFEYYSFVVVFYVAALGRQPDKQTQFQYTALSLRNQSDAEILKPQRVLLPLYKYHHQH